MKSDGRILYDNYIFAIMDNKKRKGESHMWQLNILLLIELVVGAGILILLYKISIMKKRVDDITKEVEKYISFVIEDEETKMDDGKNPEDKGVLVGRNLRKDLTNDEARSSLIQSVLGEIFP